MDLFSPGPRIATAAPSTLSRRAACVVQTKLTGRARRRRHEILGLAFLAQRTWHRGRTAVKAQLGDDSEDMADLIQSLQGQWEDDVGLNIKVTGNEVDFADGTGVWHLKSGGVGTLELRGTRFVGTKDSPMWQFPNGVKRSWNRPKVISPEELQWMELFLKYKAERLQLRRQLWARRVAKEPIEALQEKWDAGTVDTLPLELEQQARLFAGRHIVPGSCFLHRRYGYRAVVVGCEPWCTANGAWKRMMGVSQLPRGEYQPFYHCLVDERDRPGGQMTFVGEENVTVEEGSDAAFPLEHVLVEDLLIRCDELRSYLPSPKLERALAAQRQSGNFNVHL